MSTTPCRAARIGLGLLCGLALFNLTAASLPRAAVWTADVPGGDPAFAARLAAQVKAAGYEVESLDSLALTNTATLQTNHFDLLAVANARILPIESVPAIEAFLRQGGDLLALGLPGWEEPRFRLAGRWVSRADYERALNDTRPHTPLLDLAHADLSQWKRHTNDPQSPATRELVSDAGTSVLHVTIGNLTSWDNVEPPRLPAKFAPGETLTCFRAKGGPRTTQLALEWVETDGSRWIASVDLSTNWQNYALTPAAFKAWEPTHGRGGAGDRLQVGRVVRFTVGLALSHNSLELGPHEYWFADLGAAPNPFGDEAPPVEPRVPRLESLSPGYQCYSIQTDTVVQPREWQALIREPRSRSGATNAPPLNQAAGLLALHPRPRGVGWKQDRPWRWQPLLAARDAATGDYRGTVGVLVVHREPPFQGGAWALFTPADPAFYEGPDAQRWLHQILRRLRRGVFLVEGGAEYFTLFTGQTVPLGAQVVNLSQQAATNLEVSLSVIDQRGDTVRYRHREPLTLDAGAGGSVATNWNPTNWPAGGCVVACQLLQDGRVVDEFYHELNRWEPKVAPQFITATNGGFQLGGKPWRAHGVNYMPSSGIGVASEYFEFWLGRGAYDPEVIERDLRRVQAMGLNAVSVFVYHRDLDAQHLLDFLFRCERLGLKVNLSLRPGTPMEFRWSEMKALIEHYRLAENDTVLAYDLAWEPSHYDHAYQVKHYTPTWNAWVAKRYGSVEAVGQVWGEDVKSEIRNPKSESLSVPPARWLTADGPWRKAVADYRRFLDELLAEKYAEARRLVRSIDSHHPVSFRMQLAGDPTFNQEGLLPYDFYGLRDAVDIWEPEAYGRIGDWSQVRPGEFTVAYARLCDLAKPVVWAEMGFTCWDAKLGAPNPQKLDFAGRYYADFYRMLNESGSDGVFFWWYPGGYRLNERSDFGIINPDGTDRPVTKAIREWGPKFLSAPKPPAPTEWIEVDRGRDARGLPGVYDAVKARYWQAVEQGRGVGLKWAPPPGAPESHGSPE